MRKNWAIYFKLTTRDKHFSSPLHLTFVIDLNLFFIDSGMGPISSHDLNIDLLAIAINQTMICWGHDGNRNARLNRIIN